MTMTEPTPTGCACGDDSSTDSAGLTRRQLLSRAAAVGAGTAVAGGLATRMSFAATPYDGDVLVVLSLRGGFDGLNAIVPVAEPRYLQLRPNVGIHERALLPLDARFGLHPSLRPLQPFWKDGTFGVVHAVGMADPTRSHFAAMAEMERAAPGTSVRSGWIDRLLGLRGSGTTYQAMQVGDLTAAAAFSGPKPELAMLSVNDFTLSGVHDGEDYQRWKRALGQLNANAPAVVSDPAHIALSALGTARELQRAGYRPRSTATYPNTPLGHALKDLARLIKARVGLQVAAVDYGDWDMHVGQGTFDAGWMHDHLTELSDALAAFGTDLGAGLDNVTLVTLTEFGRRVEENGSGGTDHGYGQAVLMMGGGVKGGQVHGAWPGLAPGNLVDGDLNATTDYRQVLAEILEKRCGAASVSDIFPEIGSSRPGVVNARV